MKNLYAVILAGGTGTRFWPKSRRSNPKQFLELTGKGTLFQEAARRLQPKIPPKNIFVVTNASYRRCIQREIACLGIPMKNVLWEPCGRNTAPAICWAAAHIHALDKEAVMAVFPADHHIENKIRFHEALNTAARLARTGSLVTFGIAPTRPETGYGYLTTGHCPKSVLNQIKGNGPGKSALRTVLKFTEKPSLETARRFLKKKSYLWNSGMFVWKTSVILEAFKEFLPQVHAPLAGRGVNPLAFNRSQINKIWANMPNISIDYGILEKASHVLAVAAADWGWSDLGSWQSVDDISRKDKDGNVLRGDVIGLNCRDSFVWAHDRLIAAVGLENIVVVDTGDGLLVCKKEAAQDVREVAAILQKKKRLDLL